MENLREWAATHGLMDNSMKVNGSMGWSKVQVCGEEQKVIHTLDNGNLEKQTVMECIPGSMETDIKDNLKNA